MFEWTSSLGRSVYYGVLTGYQGYRYAREAIGVAFFYPQARWMPTGTVSGPNAQVLTNQQMYQRLKENLEIRKQSLADYHKEYNESLDRFWSESSKVLNRSWEILRDAPKNFWLDLTGKGPTLPLNQVGAINFPVIALTSGISLITAYFVANAAARRAELEGKNPGLTRRLTFAGTLGAIAAQSALFGNTLYGGAVFLAATLAVTSSVDIVKAMRYGARFRQGYVRSTVAPWSFSTEPMEFAQQMNASTAVMAAAGLAAADDAAMAAARYYR